MKDDTPMNTLIRQTSDLVVVDPSSDPRIEQARQTMRSEVCANLVLIEGAANHLEDLELELRQQIDLLASMVAARNAKAVAYNAGVRNLSRMLASVAEVRRQVGDDGDAVIATLEYALPEVDDSWATVEWPEEQWPASDIIDIDGFDLDAIVGSES